MIGDHHGWTVRRATLLVTATDEILGTHRVAATRLPPSAMNRSALSVVGLTAI
jgi:hypothetical protein